VKRVDENNTPKSLILFLQCAFMKSGRTKWLSRERESGGENHQHKSILFPGTEFFSAQATNV
jgi:hypothetical protein